MAISVTVAGPDFIGAPVIHLSADGNYSPDVMDDMTRHIADLYYQLFDELTVDPDGTDPDREDPDGEGSDILAGLKLVRPQIVDDTVNDDEAAA